MWYCVGLFKDHINLKTLAFFISSLHGNEWKSKTMPLNVHEHLEWVFPVACPLFMNCIFLNLYYEL